MRTRNCLRRAAAHAALFVVCIASFLATGCARVGALTEVNPDGSLTRTVTLRGAGAPAGGGMSMGPTLTDLVDAPQGAGWKVTKATEENEQVVTATRTVPAGSAPWSDIAIHGDPVPDAQPAAPADAAPAGAPGPAGPQAKPKPGAKPAPQKKPAAKPAPPKPATAPPADEPSFDFAGPKMKPGPVNVTNEVSVRVVAPGRLEYREVFRWKGKRPEGPDAPDAEVDEAFRKAVPPAVAADPALAKAIQTSIAREMLRSIFGPGEPIMPLLLFHTDYAEYRLRRNLTAAVRKAFREHAGDRMTEAQRLVAEKQLVDALTKSITTKSKAQASPGGGGAPAAPGEKKDDGGGSPVALFVRVKMPGKVIATNGEYDEYTGEVVWPLYSAAAGFEDVILTATCEVAK